MTSTRLKDQEENAGQQADKTKKQYGNKNDPHRPAIDTAGTDSIKNTATQAEGLNEEKSNGKELEPGTH